MKTGFTLSVNQQELPVQPLDGASCNIDLNHTSGGK